MDESLKKFNQLPPEVKNQLSAPAILKSLEDLEKRFKVKLSKIFIKLAVDDLSFDEAVDYLSRHFNLSQPAAQVIRDELASILAGVNRDTPPSAPAPEIKSKDSPVGAGFAFAMEDEKEVKDLTKKIQPAAPRLDYNLLTGEIITAFGEAPKDELLLRRLRNIIVARLRDVRDELETIEALEKEKSRGGLEFSPEASRRLIMITREKIKSGPLTVKTPQSEAKIDFPAKKPFTQEIKTIQEKKSEEMKARWVAAESAKVKDAGSKLNVAAPTKPFIKKENGLPVVEIPDSKELLPDKSFEQPVNKSASASFKKPAPVAQPEIKPEPKIFSHPIPPKALSGQTPDRPNLDGVKFVKKLFGLIEELNSMTLIEFRRLSENPKEATAKIKEKIDLLEKESYRRRLEGVDAWQQSEVNRFYRLLGQKSLAESRGVETIINERLAIGKPTLTIEEFNAIMELNQSLRF